MADITAPHFHPILADASDGQTFTMLGTTMRLIAKFPGTTRESDGGPYKMQTFTSRLRYCFGALLLLIVAVSAIAEGVSPDLLSGLKWRLIGPFRGGRVVAVAGMPGDATTFYFGAVNGGVWRTTDAGMVWTPIFDGQNVASIGALAIAPSDSKTIYAGTGESDIRSDLSSGNGVYKSVDGGRTWIHVGLENTRQISRIVVDPKDSRVVYVGALGSAYQPNPERGVYKSIDGGMHWTLALNQGPEIGVSDLAICSSDSNLLFAGTWHTRRAPWSAYAPIDGPGGGLFRSQDAGKTWSRVEDKGLPEGDWGRVGIDVSANCRRVYALIQAQKAGLYRSDDGGNTWALENADHRLTSRAWYFSGITIEPQNPDVVYIPNVALFRSEDGGKTISVVRGAPGGDDYHQIWIDPTNSARMILGTDQGATISLDRGRTWSTWYNQPTAQLYHVITDNQFPYFIYGTQQDSGTIGIPSRTDHHQITPRDWFLAGSSESGYIVLDPHDPNVIYESGFYGTAIRFNRRTGFSQDISPWPALMLDRELNQWKYRAPWSTVLVSSQADPKALYLGTQYVLKTVDDGLHWDTISGDLTRSSESPGNVESQKSATIEDAKQRGYGVVSTIAPSAINRDLIWVGSDTGVIHLTKDGGKTWANVTPRGIGDWSEISLLETSHYDPAVAYAVVDRSRLDDQTPYIYRTSNYGASWQLVTQGIPAPAFVRAVREDTQTKGLLFAGTELGVYVSFDDGDHWQSLQLNLPVTSVRDLTIHGDDLVIATHGRSFWILDNITPLRQATAVAKASKAWLFRPATATRVDNDGFAGTPLPPEEPTAENPPVGAMIDYFLDGPAKEVTLEIFDAHQNLVQKFSSVPRNGREHAPLSVAERWFPKSEVMEKTPGMHRFIWSLAWGRSGGPAEDEEADFDAPGGPKVVPGTYHVRLTVDGQAQSQLLQVVMDPRSSATADVLAQQFQLGKRIFSEMIEIRRVAAEINRVQKQLAGVQDRPEAQSAEFKAALSEAQSSLANIHTHQEKAPLEAPGLLDAYKDLTSALRVVESGDRPVPVQAVAVYEESSRQAKACIRTWSAFKETKLPQLNRQLRRANLAPLDQEDANAGSKGKSDE